MGVFNNIKNFLAEISPIGFKNPTMTGLVSTQTQQQHDLNNRIIRLKLERIKQDIATARQALSEAENAYYPNRTEMQRMFIDTVIGGHVRACMRRRKDLTLLKAFQIQSGSGVNLDDLTKMFSTQWFYILLEYVLDAQFYGYSYINWTSVVNNKIEGLQLIKRHNISPDREMVLPFPNSFLGFSIFEPDNADWSLWIPTPSENGISNCGMGLLYPVAIYEIYLRNLMGFNADFVETFSQPFRHGKTDKREGKERDAFEAAVSNMGSQAYAITDPLDSIEFLNEGAGGNGYKSYESFQERCEKTISKLFFGHSDAIDSRTGKLGSEQGEDSPVAKAIVATEAADGRFVEGIINDFLMDKLRNLGFKIPADAKFVLMNDKEEQDQKQSSIEFDQSVATVVKTLSDSGYDIDPTWITKQTQIPLTKKPEPKDPDIGTFGAAQKKAIQNAYKSV